MNYSIFLSLTLLKTTWNPCLQNNYLHCITITYNNNNSRKVQPENPTPFLCCLFRRFSFHKILFFVLFCCFVEVWAFFYDIFHAFVSELKKYINVLYRYIWYIFYFTLYIFSVPSAQKSFSYFSNLNWV